jgi:hypothetical protein
VFQCWDEAAQAEARWFARVRQMPVAPRYAAYLDAWAKMNELASLELEEADLGGEHCHIF